MINSDRQTAYHYQLSVLCYLKDLQCQGNPSQTTTWFPQIMTYLFQGLFKDFWGTFSRTFQGLFFVLSNFHSRKNDQQWTFQIRYTETIWFWVCQKNGGEGEILVCVFNFFRWFAVLWLWYSLKQFSLKGGVWGSSPRKKLLELVQNPAILDNSGGYTSLVIMSQ